MTDDDAKQLHDRVDALELRAEALDSRIETLELPAAGPDPDARLVLRQMGAIISRYYATDPELARIAADHAKFAAQRDPPNE